MTTSAKATQNFVPLQEVRDGIIILKDGGLRAILAASSVNLSLKSYDEQKAIIGQFQSFLNSLDFSVQIIIQSRRYDIRPYLEMLGKREREVVEPLLKIQIKEYVEFVRTFTDEVNVMTKRFYLVIPYTISTSNPASSSASMFSFGKKDTAAQAEQGFEEKRTQLDQRMNLVKGGLSGIGVKAVKLGTEEVVELFYKLFNPGEGTGIIKE